MKYKVTIIVENIDNVLLKLARLSIYEKLTGQKLIDRKKLLSEYPELGKEQAVFVTLEKTDGKRESLRGCIGSLLPVRPLIDDVIYNAKASAFNDPRFPPLSLDEFDQIKIEISLLSIPQTVQYKTIDELKQIIKPFKHGVILNLSGRRATFLPQVWKQLPDFNTFFQHLCLKAGLPENCLKYHPDISVYEVKEIKEE